MLAEFMDLCMAIVAGRNAIVGAGGLNLPVLLLSVCQPCILIARLEKSAAAAAAVIVRPVGEHFDEIFFSHDRLHHKPEIFGNGIAKGFPHNLARILNRKRDLQLLVPVRVNLQFSFPDPFGVVFVDIFNFKGMLDVELFQSCQD
jgi:hypothetical protein